MGEIRVKTADGWLTLPSHEKTADGWKDIPTHIMTATGWQGELTSQSPLEFRATGQSLLDWRVEGRTSKNLFDINGEYTSTSRQGTQCCVVVDNHIKVQKIVPGNSTIIKFKSNTYSSGQYLVSCKLTGELRSIRLLSSAPFTGASYNNTYEAYFRSMVLTDGIYTLSYDPTESATIGFVPIGDDDATNVGTIEEIMLNEGDTALPYEPYGGVGERTENLFDLSRLPSDTWTTDTQYYMNGGIATSKVVNPTAVTISVNNDTLSVTTDGGNGAGFLVEVKPSTEYRLAFAKSESLASDKTSCTYAFVDTSEAIGQLQAIYGNADGVVFTTDSNTKYVYFVFRKAAGTISYSNIMLTEGSTAPSTYIPYGYKIPVNVSGKNLFDSGFVVAATMTLNNDVHTVYFPVSVGEPRKTWFGNVESGRKYNIKLSNNDHLLIAGYTQRYTQAEIEAYTSSNQLTTPYVIYDSGLSDDVTIDIPNNIVMIGVYYATSSAPTATLEVYYDTTTNLYTDAQLMDGDSLDYTTDQTAIPITQGDNTLTVGTAVQPSKVFVKFEG